MPIKLSIEEELDIREYLSEPHLTYIDDSVLIRKKVAYSILKRDLNEILLIDSSGFLIDSVFSGLTEKHIEHIAKNAPEKYKQNLLEIQNDKGMMEGVFEIAKSMDEDLGEKVTQNQQRIKNVIQYIKDNQIVFQF